MTRFYALLILPFALLSARAGVVAPAASEAAAPRIILPGGAFGQSGAPAPSLSLPTPSLIVPDAPSLIIPDAPRIEAPKATIIVAARALSEEEAALDRRPTQAELKALGEALAPARDESDAGASAAERVRALDSAFDGKLAPEAAAWDDVSERFARGPKAPALPVVQTAARSLIARLLPDLYRRVPHLAAYDRSERPATGHTWTPEKGHLIEINPVSPDSDGSVPSSFGGPGEPLIQQKISHLMEYAHEYFHVLFDSALKRKDNHPMHSVYAAMTEGFAVSGETLLAERMLERALSLGLGPRDGMDLASLSRGRGRWLDVEDNHYSEGVQSWRKAYAQGGTRGMLEFLASLSARRMIAIPRSDAAYQLALGEPELLSAYLGHDRTSADGRGLEAFAKAARGETLDAEESRDAAAAVERAGPEGWRRLFERTLLADKRLKDPAASSRAERWWESAGEPAPSVEPVFALARLSPAAGAELARFLAATLSQRGGGARLFEKAGPNDKLNAIVAGAESLPWDAASRKSWDDGLMRWLIGG